jgi:hypothetical protein
MFQVNPESIRRIFGRLSAYRPDAQPRGQKNIGRLPLEGF